MNATAQFDTIIGSRLRLLRHLHGMTQAELGQKLGLSFQQIQKYERGTNAMSAARLLTVCKLFNVSADEWFIEQKSDKLSPPGQGLAEPSAISKPHDRQAILLLARFHAIQAERKRSLLCELAEMLADQPSA